MFAARFAGLGSAAEMALVHRDLARKIREAEVNVTEIKIWEDKIVDILADGHNKRIKIERELKELKMDVGPEMDARFCVDLDFKASKQLGGKHDHSEQPPFSEFTGHYHDLTYPELVMIQKAVTDALIGLGLAVLEEMKIDPTKITRGRKQ